MSVFSKGRPNTGAKLIKYFDSSPSRQRGIDYCCYVSFNYDDGSDGWLRKRKKMLRRREGDDCYVDLDKVIIP